MSGNFTIARCAPEQRPDALRILHTGLSADQQIGLVHALKVVQEQDGTDFDGLLVAVASGSTASQEIVGVVWAQLLAGQTAVVWLPPASCPAGRDLLTSLAAFLDENEIALAQFLTASDASVDADLLAAAQFHELAKLAYLTVDCQQANSSQPDSELVFLPNASDESERVGKLLLRTYVDSQDCPKLNGVRSSTDVLAGYREQGVFAPERWFFVQHQGRDVGTLILTAYADSGNWELVYMGLVPEARGCGWGQQILDFSLWQARQGGAQQLVLAVDEANRYALDMYQLAGFVTWDHRTVYARLRTPS